MAELKRSFAQGQMNKDLDERLVPDGQYTDALNVQVGTSDTSEVGTLQTLLGNTTHRTMAASNGDYGIDDCGGAVCVGTVADKNTESIYWFIHHKNGNFGAASGAFIADHILRYNTQSNRVEHVFVDIFQIRQHISANSTTSNNFIYIAAGGNTFNFTGIRIGMKLIGTMGTTQYGEIDNVLVSDIIYDTGNDRFKIYLEKNGASFTPTTAPQQNDVVTFNADRVLKFDPQILINAINVHEGYIYWTDGYTEPKRIHIEKSILGTGGTEYLQGAGVNGYASGSPTDQTFTGDTRYFNTRLVVEDGINSQGASQYKIALRKDSKRVVYVEEQHVTVIRKAPKKALDIDMFRDLQDRIPTGGSVANLSNSEVVGLDLSVYSADDVIPLSAFNFTEPVDFRVGDILLFTAQVDTDDEENFLDYQMRCEVVASNVVDADNLFSTGFELLVLSISSVIDQNDTSWFVRLEKPDPLFELQFPRFSYRYKYADGEYSTFAPWSRIAFLPGEFRYRNKDGYNLGMTNQLRRLILKNYYAEEDCFPEDVTAIDILYKEDKKPPVYVVKTITEKDGHPAWPAIENDFYYDNNARGQYTLKTDLLHQLLPSNQLIRTQDSVPVKALAQEITANRLVYGNFTLGNTVKEEPHFTVGYSSTPIVDTEFGLSSVKSIRTYQLGVVFSDEYGRETPVLTASDFDGFATTRVEKDQSHTQNKLTAKFNTSTYIPSWAKYYSYYVKETSSEYYNLAMDRWYFAEDGNIWISFPSADRSKLDTEDYLTLKKGHGTNQYVHDKARYKVIAIENEAPDYIKTDINTLGRFYNDDDDIGNSTRGYPLEDQTYILVNAGAFEGVFGNTDEWLRTPDRMTIRFFAGANESEEYEIAKITKLGPDEADDYKIKIAGKFNEDILITSTADTFATRVDGLIFDIYEHKVVNRPEFDGRFFVKIQRDSVLDQYVLRAGNGEYSVKANWGLRYLNNNGYWNAFDPNAGAGTAGYLGEIPEDAKEWGGGDDYVYQLSDGTHFKHSVNGGDSFKIYNTAAESMSRSQAAYSHHTSYWWGNEAEGDVPDDANSGTEVKNKKLHADPIRSVNDRNQSAGGGQAWRAEDFWIKMAGRQEFFIDACTAYSWTGRHSNRPGGYFGGNLFQAIIAVGQNNDAYGNWSTEPDAQDKPEGAPSWNGNEHPVGNMKSNHGMPSRGIWNGGKCMDISWTGMGTGYNGSNWSDIVDAGGTPHQLSEVAGDNYEAAARFIRELVEPGAQFRFQKDPDETVYTVSSFANYPEFGYSTGAGTYWKHGTNIHTGAFGIRNYATGNKKNQYRGHNLRQRWTIMVNPPIGSGVSGYNPMRGTAANADTQVAGLHHDGTNQDVIEILEPYVDPRGNAVYARNPAIWETEPREQVELDIYWEASNKNPLYLAEDTKEKVIPIGSTFSIGTVEYTVSSWANDNTVNFAQSGGSGLSALTPITDGDILTINKPDTSSAEIKVNGTVAAGANQLVVYGMKADLDTDGAELWTKKHVLNWANCFAFGNGVESDRIRDDFNAETISNGVKASTVAAGANKAEVRKHSMIWSGVYNSVTKQNALNQFIIGEDITKDLNPAHGSIQALVNRESRLVVFCEDRVLRAETNKDLLFNSDGKPQVVATNAVIGAATAYQGDYGVATNPESIAATPYRMYFTDTTRGHVLQLTNEGITSISNSGMIDYFRDSFREGVFRCIGMYDESKREYNLGINKYYFNYGATAFVRPYEQTTLAFAESTGGWTSFRSYVPEKGVSLNNKFFTFNMGHLYEHHAETSDSEAVVPRNNFYGVQYTSTVNIPFNASPQSVKTFNSISYEGTTARITNFDTESSSSWLTGNYSSNSGLETNSSITDGEYYNLGGPGADSAGTAGWYTEIITTDLQTSGEIEFINREGKYYGAMCGEATTLSNLDEHEFSVQGLGTASFAHDTSGQGEAMKVTVANNTSTTYQGADGGGGVWDSTADVGFTVASNTFNIVTGTAEPAQTVDLVIHPNNAEGYFIQASDFTIGGAGGPTATNEYTGGNVDTPVAKVVFSDLGTAGEYDNTVRARVHLNSYTPSNNNAIYVDIDGTVSQSIDRDVCLNVNIQEQTGVTLGTPYADLANITESDISPGSDPNLFTGKHTGTVQSNTSTVIAKYTINASTGYYLQNINVMFNELGHIPSVPGGYEDYYSFSITETTSNSQTTGIVVEISYTPPEDPLLSDPPAAVGFCQQKHHAFINYDVIAVEPTDSFTDIITDVIVDQKLPYTGGFYPITVKGKADTKYKISLLKKTSETDATTVSRYDFVNNTFTTDVNDNTNFEATIPSGKKKIHRVLLPQVTANTRYDVIIHPFTVSGGAATLDSRVPTKDGDKSIIQHGIKTITLQPVTATAGNFGTLPTQTIKRPTRYEDDDYSSAPYYSTSIQTSAASTTNRILLKNHKNLNRVVRGMKVVGTGVGPEVRVTSVRENAITLSAAVSVASGADIKFIQDNTSCVGFSLTIPPNSSPNTLNVTGSVDVTEKISGFESSIRHQVNGVVSGAKIIDLNSTRGIIVGMEVSHDRITDDPSITDVVKVTGISSATRIAIDTDVTLADDEFLTFTHPLSNTVSNTDVSIINAEATKVGDNIVITGNLKVGDIDNTLSHEVYIDDIITVS